MIRLYLVRHAESVDNLEGRISGQSDPPLSPLGVRQAEAVGRRLADLDMDAVYSSDLARAVDTIEPLARSRGLEVRTTALLREAHMGDAQGMTRAELDARYPEDARRWREDSVRWRLPGAERVESVIDRCRVFLEGIASDWPDDAVIAAAVHQGSLRGLICAALALPVESYPKFYCANASVSVVMVGTTRRLAALNDTCHLERLGAHSGRSRGNLT